MKTAFKRVLSLLLAATMVFGTVGAEISGIDFGSLFSLKAEAASYSGTCGSNLNWSLNTSTGVLNITGTGAMKDYMYYSTTPWCSYNSYIKTVQISDNVTTIGDHAFDACSNIINVTIGKNVKTIGEKAFYGCRRLNDITIPNSVTIIDNSAFANCETLKNVTLGNNLETIGESAFECCYELSVVIPDSVITIGKKAFYECVNAEISISQNSKLVAIGENAFEYCRNFKNINLPDSVNRIGLYAFSNTGYYDDVSNWENSLLYIGKHLVSSNSAASGSVDIKSGTLTIAEGAFYDRYNISSVTIPGSVKAINSLAFYMCRGLENVTISEGVTTIKEQAFTNCYKLKCVTIPDSVTTIEDAAFAGCTALKYVHIPVGVTTIGSDILNSTSAYICSDTEDCNAKTYADENSIEFRLCDEHTPDDIVSGQCGDNLTWTLNITKRVLDITGTDAMWSYTESSKAPWYDYRSSIKTVNIADGVTTIGDYAFCDCYNLTSVTIPNSVKTIGDRAFESCDSLTSVTIPDSVTTIGDLAFNYCANLTNITVDNDNKNYSSDEYGVLFNKDKTTLIQYSLGNARTSYIIPDSVTTIGASAFKVCRYITRVTIGNGVTIIGEKAFGSSSLASVTIPDSVTTIGASAFESCNKLTSVTIPDSVTTIGASAFESCHNLTSVTIGNSVTIIGDSAFSSCYKLTSITIPDSVTTIGAYAFCRCTSLENVTIGKSVTIIGEGAFKTCDHLTSVTIPDGVTIIDDGAFSECTSLTSVIIPDSVKTIGDAAFSSCSNLTGITFPDSVKDIGNWAFESCNSLTSVTIPDSIKTIGDSAFRWCASLTSVTIGNSVTTIGASAFESCNRLTSIIIPDSVTIIGEHAFAFCDSLEYVHIPASVTSISNNALTGNSVYICSDTNDCYARTYADNKGIEFRLCDGHGVEKVLTKIEIKTMPTKKEYFVGDTLDTTGLTLTATYNDGTTETITTGFTCSPTKLNTAGKQTITVAYGGKTCTFDVTVKAVELVKVEVKTMPTKAEYFVGDTLNTTGLTLTATYNNGTIETITSGFTCSPTKLNTAGKQTITVTYEGKTCTFDVTVKAVELVKIEIKTMPTKTEYFVGDTLNITGLTLTATYNNGSTKTITSGFTCSPMTLTKVGTQVITVSYGGKTCTFDVTVKEKPVSNDYSVTYMVNGKRYAKYIVTVGDPVPAPAVNPIVDGMIFEGWSPEIVQLMPANDLVYTAVFHKHVYTGSIAIHPTCTQHGIMLYTCSCGDSYNEIITAPGHSWGNWITVIEATANSNGQKVRYCSRCGEAEYEVIPAPSANFRVDAIADQIYTGFGLYPAVKVYSLSGQRLDEYDHYEVSYENNVNCGIATAIIKGIGEYSGVIKVNFNIVKKNIANLSFAEIPDVTYSGDAYTPDPVIYYGDILLVKDVDYTVSYSANINIGKATITITGIGNYTGTKIIYFNISKNETSFSIPVIGAQVYTGKAVTPDFNLFSGDKLLIKDVDYTVTYENNINVGYGRIIIKGIGNYSGTIVVIFRITSVNISLVTVPNFDDVVYDGNEFTPDFSKNPIIFGDKELTEGVDYKVEIYNNRNAGTVKIVIIGIGNFTGTIVIYVNITAISISGVSVSTIGDVEYNGSAQTPSFKVTKNGKTLVKGADYTVEYRNNIAVGTATVAIKGIGNYKGEKSVTFEIVEPTYYELTIYTKSETLGYDSTMQVYAEVNPYIDRAYTFIYSSSNSNIASVNEYGVVKALDEGEVIITVTVVDENGNPVLNPDGEEISSTIKIKCTMTFWQKIIKFFRSIAAFFTNLFTFSIGLQMQ